MENDIYNPYFLLSLIANICQLADFDMNVKQISNDIIFQELQKQNKKYLQKIISQNEEIIKLLKRKEG